MSIKDLREKRDREPELYNATARALSLLGYTSTGSIEDFEGTLNLCAKVAPPYKLVQIIIKSPIHAMIVLRRAKGNSDAHWDVISHHQGQRGKALDRVEPLLSFSPAHRIETDTGMPVVYRNIDFEREI